MYRYALDQNLVKKENAHYKGKLKKPFEAGDSVRIWHQHKICWTAKGKIAEEVAARSYKVQTEDSRRIRRNNQHLRKTLEESQPSSEEVKSEIKENQEDVNIS